MLKISFADALDILFYTASCALVSFGVLRFLRLSLPLCILFSVLFAAAAFAGSSMLILGSREKKVRGKKEKEARDALLLHLALEKEEKVRAALLRALIADGKEAALREEAILLDGVLYLPSFTMEPLSADMVASFLRKYGETPFVLVCNSLSEAAEKLLLSFQKSAMKGDEVYALFSRTDTIPDPLICSQIPRRTARMKLRRAFSKRNARPFFVSGSALLFMSLFVLFPLYYLVAGSILMAAAVLIRAVGYREG